MKIYTRTGDDGTTGLIGNARVRKDDARIDAFGCVDELNAALGMLFARLPIAAGSAEEWITRIQNDLFAVGAMLATPSGAAAPATLGPDETRFLEDTIDRMEKELPPLKNFILPRGTDAAACAHLARAVARRAERSIVSLAGYDAVPEPLLIFMNRLSDWLFVAARWINRQEAGAETVWTPPAGSSSDAAMPSPDRLGATLQKLEHDKEKRKTLFEKSAAELQKKRDAAEKLFRSNVDQIKRDGGKVEKPLRDMDLD